MPTCFSPFLAVTNEMTTATKKLYIGIIDIEARIGLVRSKINFLALKYNKKAKTPEIIGDVTQLEAISITVSQDT